MYMLVLPKGALTQETSGTWNRTPTAFPGSASSSQVVPWSGRKKIEMLKHKRLPASNVRVKTRRAAREAPAD